MKRNHKKWTLKDKIFYPYLGMMVLMIFFVMLAFNISMRVYVNRIAQDEINDTRETVKVLLKKEIKSLTTEANENGSLPKAREITLAIAQSLRLTEMTSMAEIALLNAEGRVLLPKEADMSAALKNVTDAVSSKISGGLTDDTFDIVYDQVRYLVSYEKYNDTKVANRNLTLVIMVSRQATTLLVRRTNLTLLAILILTAFVGAIISRRLASMITRPIREVSFYAKNIALGNFGTLKIDPDTLEIEQLYKNLSEMSKTLQLKEQTKIDFLQNFSHDLRTPLMSIQGYAEGIATGVFEEATKPASIIASESLRLKHLVDQLITLSRLDMTQSTTIFTVIDLKAFLGILVERYEGFATKEHKKILINCEKEYRVLSNEELLEKSLGNIVSNAIRYAKTHVIIDVIQTPLETQIRIQDDGNGIPMESLPHLFDRFYKGNDGNFGLGLAIADAAVKLIKGRLTAENHSNGALFLITLYHG